MYNIFEEKKWLAPAFNDSSSMGSSAILSAMNGSTALPTESSTVAPTDVPPTIPEYLGFIACAVAVLFFGTNFIPVKQFKTGDGKAIMISQSLICVLNVMVCKRIL